MFSFYVQVMPNCQRQIDIAIDTVSSHHFFPIFLSQMQMFVIDMRRENREHFTIETPPLIYRHRNMNGMNCGSVPYRNIQRQLLYTYMTYTYI